MSKEKQEDIKQVLVDSIQAIQYKKKALLARKYILGSSKPEEFIPKKSLFGPAVAPIEQNISYAAIKRDLLFADVNIEISQLDDQLLARQEHLKMVNSEIEKIKDGENNREETDKENNS